MKQRECVSNKLVCSGRLIAAASVICGIVFMISCVDHEFQGEIPVNGDYFPMTEGSRWEYVTRHRCNWLEAGKDCYDTIRFVAKISPSPWSGQHMGLSAGYGIFQWIKKSNKEYFAIGAYVPEYKFLDTGLPRNSSWAEGEDESMVKERFSIIEVNTTRVVRGVRFDHVLVVLRQQLWEREKGVYKEESRSYHYYARGVGEIYTYYPASGNRKNGDMEVFLTSYVINE